MTENQSNIDYLNDVLPLLTDGMSSSMEEPSKDIDQETLEYLNELR